ncbi:hypothetical protein ANN_03265 [Periplaneta americana]|uniref:Transposable element P transposase-like GTP-binding insertion domain-containing protein n=1 Tax=Periplaneta americana TaxID=6978 RepID=A0ABQ8TZR8_PERAM|nr:hypothetical protein ANN_03265 [Periplaneta americana]
MHVSRAVDISSTDIISALEFLKEHGLEFGISEFKNAEGTIEFLKMVNKWFTILNVKNTHQYVHKRNDDAIIFFSVDDVRLFWLENDFIPYLEWWEKSVTRKAEFISSETFQAACLTTKSAVEYIKYLLQNGFHFVLTRKFSSDEIESLFSCIRQLAGSNNQTNAASVTQALHKILVTGLVSSSFSRNVRPDSACSSWMPSTRKSVNKEIQDVYVSMLNSEMLAQLKHIEIEPTELPSVSMTTAVAAYIGGYLVCVVKENIHCDDCVNRVSSAQSPSPIMALIKGKDRGGLRYPKPIFVMLLTRMERVVNEALKSMIGQPRILCTLDGKYKLIKDMFCSSQAFKNMLSLWERQLSNGDPDHFLRLARVVGDSDFLEWDVMLNISSCFLMNGFEDRFQDLSHLKMDFDLFATLFSMNIDDTPKDVPKELINLKCCIELADSYRNRRSLLDFYSRFRKLRFPRLHRHEASLISMFGSAYVSEVLFSTMKRNKGYERANLSDHNLKCALRVQSCVSLCPNIVHIV